MKTLFQKISKPHLVDLLRLSDRNRWLFPRIRYASVRSKPELISDLMVHFRLLELKRRLVFLPKQKNRTNSVPQIEYDLEAKRFRVEGPSGYSEAVTTETLLLDLKSASDPNLLTSSGVKIVAFHIARRCFLESVSRTKHSCSSNRFKANSATRVLLQYSQVNILRSPFIGSEKTSTASRDLRARFGTVV